jgi:hypothetical protein
VLRDTAFLRRVAAITKQRGREYMELEVCVCDVCGKWGGGRMLRSAFQGNHISSSKRLGAAMSTR